MPAEERPGEMSREDVERGFEKLTRAEQKTTLKGMLGLKGWAADRAEVITSVIETVDWPQTQARDIAFAINKKLDVPRRKDVIVHTLESVASPQQVLEVVREVVDKLVDEALLTPGFFSRWVPSSQGEQREEQQRKTGYSVEVHFTEKAYDVINELKNRSSTVGSLSAVLTQALAFEKWYRDAVAANHRVLIERGRGDFREVKRP